MKQKTNRSKESELIDMLKAACKDCPNKKYCKIPDRNCDAYQYADIYYRAGFRRWKTKLKKTIEEFADILKLLARDRGGTISEDDINKIKESEKWTITKE